MLKRELQVLDELFSREPENRAEWAGFARGLDIKNPFTNKEKKEPIRDYSTGDVLRYLVINPPIRQRTESGQRAGQEVHAAAQKAAAQKAK